MAGADTGNEAAGTAGGAIGGPILGAVLGGMHLGDLYSRLVRGTPHIGDRRREEIRAAGVPVNHGQYSLPNIPGTTANEALYTNVNTDVIRWYRQWAAAGRPVLYPRPPTPTTVPPPTTTNLPPIAGYPSVDYLPRSLPGFVSPDIAAFMRTGVAGIIAALLLWPTAAGRGSDLYRRGPGGILAVPRPAATPGGRTRGRRRPIAVPKPRPYRPRAIPKPKPGVFKPKVISKTVVRAPPKVIENILFHPEFPGPYAPTSSPSSSSSSSSSSRPYPTTAGRGAWPYPSSSSPFPGTAPVAVPASSPWSKIGQYVAPYLGTWLSSALAPSATFRPYRNVAPDPSTQPQPQPALDPLTWPNAGAAQYAATQAQTKDCSCAKTKTRKRKPCRNPVVRSRKVTKGRKRFIITTKEIKCQASSRKKPRSPLARLPTTSSRAVLSSIYAHPLW